MDIVMSYSPFQPYVYTLAEIPVNLCLALLMGLLIATVYRLTTRGSAISQSYLLTLVMLTMVSSLVIMIIGNSLIRAFSLIGALSIIRFRTVVKENRDTAFIFLSLGSGMAAGIGNLQLAFFGTGIILLALLVLDFTKFGAVNRGVFLLRFNVQPGLTSDAFLDIFKRYLISWGMLSIKTISMGQWVEHSYMVRLRKDEQDQALIGELMGVEGIEKVTMVADSSESEL